MCAFVFVSVCNVYVHLSVKVTIVSGFNLHEKIMSECNQMGCVFAHCRVLHMVKDDRCLLVGQGELNSVRVCVRACAFVCHSVCYKLGFHSIKFDISPYQLCKSHNNVPLDLCCR